MAADQFENNYSTLLNGAIDSDDTTLTVDAPPTTMTGDFRIKIEDEIILVGSVSGSTLTGCTRGVEGTTAASHADDSVVTHVLTAGALNGMFPVGLSAAFIYTLYYDIGVAPTTAETLPSSGGALVLPFVVPSQFRLHGYKFHNRDTANARTAEFRLYVLNEFNDTMEYYPNTAATISFTPTVASDRTAVLTGGDITIPPGSYWLCIRNTSGSQSFSIGYGNVAGTFFNQNLTGATQTLGSALGSTLTQSGWNGTARSYGVAIRSNSAFGT